MHPKALGFQLYAALHTAAINNSGPGSNYARTLYIIVESTLRLTDCHRLTLSTLPLSIFYRSSPL